MRTLSKRELRSKNEPRVSSTPPELGIFFDPSMTSQSGRVLLITANVGSLFEQDQRLQEAWLKTFTERINQEMADIVVIHMQETGGKQLVIPCTL
ncbi:hypothetical protein Y032_0039g148 [Ancylostoma ceylanicum]|uniref:Endonuclease/exonuclease/phosphatase domain-containing protein n=1 Tax=Ancylostoma ceylanicum TaxID=53326 RepID=A0A016UJN4_9BILA|nr:hypothetical protein Y032_0039g148 [Ancylostoma ceylanicum]